MVDNTNGRVGVGVTSPAYKLHVAGDTLAGGIYLNNSDIGLTSDSDLISLADNALTVNGDTTIAGTTPQLTIGDADAEDALTLYDGNAVDFHIGLDDSLDALVFGTGSALGANNIMTLESGGNVGIGTTNPSSLLSLYSSSTSTSFTGFDLNWSPTATTTLTGDLFSINIGSNASLANLFAIYDNGSPLFTVSESKITSALPHEFTAAGDVSMAYDLIFTNTTSAYINFEGPGYIRTTHPSGNYDLTLSAANSGKVLIDDILAVSTSGSIGSNYVGIGITPPVNGLIVEGNVGIGTSQPAYKLEVYGTAGFTSTIHAPNIGAGTDNSVVVLNFPLHIFNQRQINVDACSTSHVIFDADMATMFLDDFFYNCQPQTCSLGLGRHIRLEGAR